MAGRCPTSTSSSPSPARPPGSPPNSTASTTARLAQQLATLDHTARHAAVGLRVKALDRHNIGTILAVDDAAGTVRVGFVSNKAATAERDLPWQHVVDPRP